MIEVSEELKNVKKVICKKEGFDDYVIDFENRPSQAEATLHAYQNNGWKTYDENGVEILPPEIEYNAPKLFYFW